MTIITADLHLTDNPRDADRWNLFPWIESQLKATGSRQVVILGDVTDAKDRHSASLVNKLVDAVMRLSINAEVLFLQGNHDFVNEGSPFFAFLRQMEKTVHFFTEPETWDVDGKTATFVPCTRDWEAAYGRVNWAGCGSKYIFCHQTFDGAIAENGTGLPGISPTVFANYKGSIFSGDIHTPQKVGKINYIGAPYRIHFGDSFKPRVVLLKDGKTTDLHFPGRGRELIVGRNIRDLEKVDHDIGTQTKIRIRLKRSEYPEWPAMRKAIKALADRRRWEICGLELASLKTKDKELPEEAQQEGQSPEDILGNYITSKKLGKALAAVGRELLKGAVE